MFAAWEAAGAFAADPGSDRPPYMIAVPPPNVTGALHMGHALNGAIQDTLIRLRGMQGYETLWICGTDHAGIATQNVVEKELREAGRRATTWAARPSSSGCGSGAPVRREIIQQYKRLGCALDYDNERFTMDEAYARAVTEVFVGLYEKG